MKTRHDLLGMLFIGTAVLYMAITWQPFVGAQDPAKRDWSFYTPSFLILAFLASTFYYRAKENDLGIPLVILLGVITTFYLSIISTWIIAILVVCATGIFAIWLGLKDKAKLGI